MELKRIIELLDDNRFEVARQQVNRRLVEHLSKTRGAFGGLLHTVHITFDNSRSPTDTIMDIRSDDTPAFLYAFANALAMRNVYISKAQFANDGGKLHDRFYVRNRFGQKLLDPADQQQLRLTAVLIKQFTHALTWAPDPAKALEYFDQFLDLILEESRQEGKKQAWDFINDKKTYPLLAKLFGASDFIWEDFLRRQHANLLPLLKDYRDAPLIKPQATLRKELNRVVAKAKTDEARKEALNRFKDQELFRIDMKHIVEPATSLPDFSLAISELAEVIVERSLIDCQAKLTSTLWRAAPGQQETLPVCHSRRWQIRGTGARLCLGYRGAVRLWRSGPDQRQAGDRQQRILRAPRTGTLAMDRGEAGRHLPHRCPPAPPRGQGLAGQRVRRAVQVLQCKRHGRPV